MTLYFRDNSVFADTFFLRQLFRDLTLDLTNLTSYKNFTDSVDDLHQTNYELSFTLNYDLKGIPLNLFLGFQIKHLRIVTTNTYSFQQLSHEFVDLSDSICLVHGKWLLPPCEKLRHLSCEESDVRLSDHPNLQYVSLFEAHISCRAPLVALKDLSVTSTTIRASDFETRLKTFFQKSLTNLNSLVIRF